MFSFWSYINSVENYRKNSNIGGPASVWNPKKQPPQNNSKESDTDIADLTGKPHINKTPPKVVNGVKETDEMIVDMVVSNSMY